MKQQKTRRLWSTTLTDGGQMTVPAAIVRRLGLKRGDKLSITIVDADQLRFVKERVKL